MLNFPAGQFYGLIFRDFEFDGFSEGQGDAGVAVAEGKIFDDGSGDEGGVFASDFGEELVVRGVGELSEEESSEPLEDSCLPEVIELSVDVMGGRGDVLQCEEDTAQVREVFGAQQRVQQGEVHGNKCAGMKGIGYRVQGTRYRV